MKIWITEIGEPLPLETNVRLHRYGQFSRWLAEHGHDVTWWTSSFSHAPKKHFVNSDQDFDYYGAKVRFIKGPGYEKNISYARIKHTKHFARRFYELAKNYEKPDIIISPVPTIDVAKSAVAYGLENNVPVITDIRDRWPDELRDLAPKPFRWLARLLLFRSYNSMKWVCKNVVGIMGVSHNDIEFGLQFAGRPQSPNDCFFPLGYSAKSLVKDRLDEGRMWCDEQGIGTDPHTFVVCFFGTIGKFFDLTTVITAAQKLSNEFPIQFIIGGKGSSLSRFKKMARNVPNVMFPGWLNGPQIAAVMERSHVGLAPYAKDAKMSMPNKPFEYMAGGLPVVSSIHGELEDIIKSNNCGKTYQADSVDELCHILRNYHDNPEIQKEMGHNARLLLEKDFDTEKVFKRVNEHLIGVVQRSKTPPKQ